ncbi:hypothetical protein ACKUB1_17815 [Methanospirillum stamsii]|uniref:Uncharacterized protein n=1 Tax=Methanospirillum stamsii TaxID=1277351 RepID=A0A2V2NDI4_9EURY|nr:hypothetical protein [Methanospirillum stamsii]PWR73353.1 hypothetical protein DLD82_10830 [Methanospirillum stamsii]
MMTETLHPEQEEHLFLHFLYSTLKETRPGPEAGIEEQTNHSKMELKALEKIFELEQASWNRVRPTRPITTESPVMVAA